MEVSLGEIQRSLLSFLQHRSDLVLFGAYAVNAYLEPSEVRMTADIDLQALAGQTLADGIKDHLHQEFYLAIRYREIKPNLAWRVYQVLNSGNRHLVDIRQVSHLPDFEIINGIQVLKPLDLMVSKVKSAYARQNQPKGFTDLRDLYSLLLTFPQWQNQIADHLEDPALQEFWQLIQGRSISAPSTDDDLLF